MPLKKWKQKNSKGRNYAHFDKKISLKQVWNYISNSKNISSHSFFPFIYYEQKFEKFDETKPKKIKEKTRPICYSSHLDRYIFSYYGFHLNQEYNKRIVQDKIDDCVLAYRDNLEKQSNIHFAKRAFDFIKEQESCFIMIGDFTKFFDMLDHKYLKDMLCSLLNVTELQEDYYAVYKNITKFSKVYLTDLLEINGLKDNYKDIEKINKQDLIVPLDKFRELKKLKKLKIEKNSNNYGIPQGSSISAVLSNIYMLEFDKKINDYVKSNNGLYLRYSDDFIIIFPNLNNTEFAIKYDRIKQFIDKIPKLDLQPEKTQIFKYESKKVIGCNHLFTDNKGKQKNSLDYLGFTFDGQKITIRDKTITKYYYRTYRKADNILKMKWLSSKGNRISCAELYRVYSKKGAFPSKEEWEKGERGNFISYVKRAEKVFGKEEPYIGRVAKVHMAKIRKRLKTKDKTNKKLQE